MISFVLVNYRSAALTVACVESVRREAAREGVPLEVRRAGNRVEHLDCGASNDRARRAGLGSLPLEEHLALLAQFLLELRPAHGIQQSGG